MENLPAPELGAVTWKRVEVTEILKSLLQALGATNYTPAVGRWKHASCTGWNATIEKRHVRHAADMIAQEDKQRAISCGDETIIGIMTRRASDCRSMLESMTRCGTSTKKEKTDEMFALHEHWALARALGHGL